MLELGVDSAKCLLLLRDGPRRMRYAIVNALNQTALAIQAAERERVLRLFHVRKAEFLVGAPGRGGQTAIVRFASYSAGRLEARVETGQKARLLLPGYERGAPRRPAVGRRVAIPLTGGPARPSAAASVPAEFTFQQLRLRAATARRARRRDVTFSAHLTRTGVQYKGAHRTFILEQTAKLPEGGVFQRTGPARGDLRLAYPFKSHPRPLDHRLGYLETAAKTAARAFAPALQRQIADAFSHASLAGSISSLAASGSLS